MWQYRQATNSYIIFSVTALYFGNTYIIIIINHRKWNDELEETIIRLQQFLEEQCDAYFVNIKQRAVKVLVT